MIVISTASEQEVEKASKKIYELINKENNNINNNFTNFNVT